MSDKFYLHLEILDSILIFSEKKIWSKNVNSQWKDLVIKGKTDTVPIIEIYQWFFRNDAVGEICERSFCYLPRIELAISYKIKAR